MEGGAGTVLNDRCITCNAHLRREQPKSDTTPLCLVFSINVDRGWQHSEYRGQIDYNGTGACITRWYYLGMQLKHTRQEVQLGDLPKALQPENLWISALSSAFKQLRLDSEAVNWLFSMMEPEAQAGPLVEARREEG